MSLLYGVLCFHSQYNSPLWVSETSFTNNGFGQEVAKRFLKSDSLCLVRPVAQPILLFFNIFIRFVNFLFYLRHTSTFLGFNAYRDMYVNRQSAITKGRKSNELRETTQEYLILRVLPELFSSRKAL